MPRPPSVRTPRAFAAILLVLVVGATLSLRARGLDCLVPQLMNRDGLVHVRQVDIFHGYAKDPNAAKILSVNPHLFSRIAALGPPVQPPGPPLSLERALELSRVLWLRLRWISLVLSLIAIPATYLLARRFMGRAGALFAAGLLATSLLHVLTSTQEKAHATVTSFLLLALLGALRVRRKPDVLSYVLFGVPAALAIGSLHNGLICLPALAVAWFLREKSPRRGSPAWVLLPLALFAASVRIFWPFLFESRPDVALAPEAKPSPTSSFLRVFTPGSYTWARLGHFLGDLWRHEPVLVALAAAGVLVWTVAALRDRALLRRALRGDLAVALAFALPYFLSMCFLVSTSARYSIAVMPVIACAGAWVFERGPVRWLAAVRGSAARTAATLAVAGALLALPLAAEWRLGTIRSRPDTLEECAAWIAENVPPEARIVVYPTFDLPIMPTDEALAENTREPWESGWAEFLARGYAPTVQAPRYGVFVQPGVRSEARAGLLDDPAEFYRRWEAQYAVLASPDDRVYRSARTWLTKHAQLLKRFSPLVSEDGRNVHVLFHAEAADPSSWSLPTLRAMGPTVEIYRLP